MSRYIGLLNMVKFNISNRMSNKMFALLAIGAVLLSIGMLFGFSALVMLAMHQLFGIPDLSLMNVVWICIILIVLYFVFATRDNK